ncbi:hypothetical protein E2C01_016236 [Portunus trituberculatus]|uniref:Uncharacterized protein n=1 Tax=Portunus trituberculatus TaxID=210409 RepID=A0A5B7DP11_PORTR|nr:hypothetical protein [Portunus trituberculatus]
MLGDLNSNLVVPWRVHSEPRGSPCESPLQPFLFVLPSVLLAWE